MSSAPRQKAVVMVSGGLDSTVAACIAHQEYEITLGLTFDYGQKARRREMASGYALTRYLGVTHRVVELPFFRSLSVGALLDQSVAIPHPEIGDLDDARGVAKDTAARVWVPNRNGIFIAVAAAWAEASSADVVVVGFNAEEAATFADNSVDFIDRQNEALKYSTRNGVRVVAPTGPWTKKEIVRYAHDHDLPLELVWSCYDGDDRMCGFCESCLRLDRAVRAADAGEWLAKRRAGRTS